jgi:hypothetical protein
MREFAGRYEINQDRWTTVSQAVSGQIRFTP